MYFPITSKTLRVILCKDQRNQRGSGIGMSPILMKFVPVITWNIKIYLICKRSNCRNLHLKNENVFITYEWNCLQHVTRHQVYLYCVLQPIPVHCMNPPSCLTTLTLRRPAMTSSCLPVSFHKTKMFWMVSVLLVLLNEFSNEPLAT